MHPHCRIAFWSAESGATAATAFSALESAAAAAGGAHSQPWSAQIASQRSGEGNDTQVDLRSRSGKAEQDIYVVSFGDGGGDASRLILVHRQVGLLKNN